jgi:hypothetical protein
LDFSVKKLIRTLGGIIAPQYFNKISGEFEIQEGENGASKVILAGSNVPDSQAIPVKISGADPTGGALKVLLDSTNIVLPVDVQARYPQTIQTHNAVSVTGSGSSTGSWIDANGFNEIGITMVNDAVTLSGAFLQFSNDGVNKHGEDVSPNTIVNHNQQTKTGIRPITARYVRLVLVNGDASAHIMSAWVYLKV